MGTFVLVLVGFGLAVGERWSQVWASLGAVPPLTVLAALVVGTVGLVGPWRAWDAVVTDLGGRVPWRASARIFFVGQLGKYVPGAIWPVVLQMRMGRAVGMTRTLVALSFVVTLVLGVATGLAFGVLAVPSLVDQWGKGAWGFLLLLPLALAGLHPRVLSALVAMLLRVTRRSPAERDLTGAGVLRAVGGTAFFWLVGGVQLWLLVVALGADPRAWLAVSIGALSLAVSIGPLLVFLPAGAGVREIVLVAALGPWCRLRTPSRRHCSPVRCSSSVTGSSPCSAGWWPEVPPALPRSWSRPGPTRSRPVVVAFARSGRAAWPARRPGR